MVRTNWRRSKSKRLSDEQFGADSAEETKKLWTELFGGRIQLSTEKYSGIDGLWITDQSSCFIEFVARRIKRNEYPTGLFDKGQWDRIYKLYKETGIHTILVVSYTDFIGFTKIPDNTVISKIDNNLVYLNLDKFIWIERWT